jgi:hypothetical protein
MKEKKNQPFIMREQNKNRTEQNRHFVSLTTTDTKIRKKKMMGTLVTLFN